MFTKAEATKNSLNAKIRVQVRVLSEAKGMRFESELLANAHQQAKYVGADIQGFRFLSPCTPFG